MFNITVSPIIGEKKEQKKNLVCLKSYLRITTGTHNSQFWSIITFDSLTKNCYGQLRFATLSLSREGLDQRLHFPNKGSKANLQLSV